MAWQGRALMTADEQNRYNRVHRRAMVGTVLGGIAAALAADVVFPDLARGPWGDVVIALAAIAQLAGVVLLPDRIAAWDMEMRRKKQM